ncbi:MAG TPA: hemerythrin domain-containing protein [Spirochaetia bacterium]|nr:hemerythrin domain-containing protein [Spirochaetia bacterium]
MTPTQILTDEHVLIVKMLDIVGMCAQRVKQGNFDDLETIRLAVDFFKNYADGFHHAKEEAILFPLLMEKANMGAPVRVFIDEHTQGRQFIKNITLSLDRIESGDRDAAGLLVESIDGYSKMLAKHINKEDLGLFKTTDKVLGAAEQSRLLAEFARVAKGKPGEEAKYHRLVEELAGKYGL